MATAARTAAIIEVMVCPKLAGPLSAALGLLLSALAARSQELPTFRRLEKPTGPSHNSIFALAQDHQGFLWIGTQDGLNRFDGYEFVIFRHDPQDPHSIAANRVDAVVEDARRRLWVGTSRGVDRLERRAGTFHHYVLGQTARGSAVLDLLADRQGRLWAGTSEGLFRYEEEDDRWLGVDLGVVGQVLELRQSSKGGVWALVHQAGQALLVEFDGAEARTILRHLGSRSSFDVDADGGLWLDARGPPWVGDRGEGEAVPLPIDRATAAVLVESSGAVWVGSREGLDYREPSGTVSRILIDPASSLANTVVALLRDRAGTLWLGTENGLYRADPYAPPFFHVGLPGEASDSVPVSALMALGDRVWVGTFGFGLYRWPTDASPLMPLEVVNRRLPSQDVRSIELVNDVLWIGMPAALCQANLLSSAVDCRQAPEDLQVVTTLAWQEDGTLWLADANRLRRRTPQGRWVSYLYDGEEGDFGASEIVSILPTSDRVWVGTWGGALKVFLIGEERFQVIPRTGSSGWEQVSPVLDLYLDGQGVLWLGTGDGLSRYEPDRYDPGRGELRHFGPRDGLPGSNVYSILEDDSGYLWLGTNRGLARFDPSPKANRRVRAYGVADGVRNVEFNRHAKLALEDGRFLFGGMAGVTVLRPALVRDNPVAPPVVLTSVEVLDRGGAREIKPYDLEQLVLAPRDRAVTFEFVALGFTRSSQNRYAYQLEGLDPEWIEAGHRRSARYTGLPPGAYVFRARGSNNDGVWNDIGASLSVVVLPPFWATWWFRTAAAAAVLSALVIFYRLRVRRLLALERMRLRIAGDLHDEMGSELSAISLVVSRLLRLPHLGAKDRRQLEDVLAASGRVTQGLRDVVWVVNPEHDTVESMMGRMRSLASSLLADLDWSFKAPQRNVDAAIEMNQRREIYLIYKELLNNVVRHARAQRVDVSVDIEDSELRLVIEDDGVGFDQNADTSGSGLRNIRRRAASMAASLAVDSQPGGGCRTELRARMTRTRQGPKSPSRVPSSS